MTTTTSLLLIPYIGAFLVLCYRFYVRERAYSIFSVTFVTAFLTALIAGSYLILGIPGVLPAHATLVYAIIGVVLLAFAISRLFVI